MKKKKGTGEMVSGDAFGADDSRGSRDRDSCGRRGKEQEAVPCTKARRDGCRAKTWKNRRKRIRNNS